MTIFEEQKVERAKKTRFMNKAKASHSIATQKANDTIAQGNALIQKMNMQTHMKAMNTLQSQIKAQSKKTFDKADKLIGKLDKMYPDTQILELPKIAMSLDKQKRKLGVDSIINHWQEKHNKADTIDVNVTVYYTIWNENEKAYEEGNVGPFPYKMPKNLSWEDKYLFLLYVWCEHPKYVSGCYITQLGGTIIFLKHIDTLDLRMAGTLFHNKLVRPGRAYAAPSRSPKTPPIRSPTTPPKESSLQLPSPETAAVTPPTVPITTDTATPFRNAVSALRNSARKLWERFIPARFTAQSLSPEPRELFAPPKAQLNP